MRRVTQTVVALTLPAMATAGLALGISNGADLKYHEYMPPVSVVPASEAVLSDREVGLITSTYDRLHDYWKGSATARLVILQGADEYVCENRPYLIKKTIATSRSTPGYCADTNTVVIPAAYIRQQTANYVAYGQHTIDALTSYTVAHEVGHDVDSDVPPMTKESELTADRLAGQFMCDSGEYDGATVNTLAQIHLEAHTDALHGTPEERYQAFAIGAAACME